MKKALVLAGGGTRGIYQVGCLHALHDIGEDDFNMVFGVSVGALNAVLIAQHDEVKMEDMYDHLKAEQIVNGYVPNPNDMTIGNMINDRQEFVPALKYYLEHHGVDIHPFYKMVHKYYDPDKLFKSDLDFYCVTANEKDHSGVLVNKEMMKEHGEDWLIASASAYPAFPVKTIDGKPYVDGGYYDNFPVDYALREGAERIIGIDMGSQPLHPLYLDKSSIVYIHPRKEMFSFLTFDHDLMQKAKIYGYNDTMKTFKRYEGWNYTFIPFDLPSYFGEFFHDLLIFETRIKYATNINERFRSEQVITDTLMNRMHLSHLTERQYLYGAVDALMEMCGADDTKLWTIYEARNFVLSSFARCAYEDYPYKPAGITDVHAYLQSLDQKGIVEKIVHANLYPDHKLINDNVMLTLYPFEAALANFVTIMMRHLNEE